MLRTDQEAHEYCDQDTGRDDADAASERGVVAGLGFLVFDIAAVELELEQGVQAREQRLRQRTHLFDSQGSRLPEVVGAEGGERRLQALAHERLPEPHDLLGELMLVRRQSARHVLVPQPGDLGYVLFHRIRLLLDVPRDRR